MTTMIEARHVLAGSTVTATTGRKATFTVARVTRPRRDLYRLHATTGHVGAYPPTEVLAYDEDAQDMVAAGGAYWALRRRGVTGAGPWETVGVVRWAKQAHKVACFLTGDDPEARILVEHVAPAPGRARRAAGEYAGGERLWAADPVPRDLAPADLAPGTPVRTIAVPASAPTRPSAIAVVLSADPVPGARVASALVLFLHPADHPASFGAGPGSQGALIPANWHRRAADRAHVAISDLAVGWDGAGYARPAREAG